MDTTTLGLNEAAQGQMVRWLEAGELFSRRLNGDESVTWQAAREAYIQGVGEVFPAPHGVSISTTMLGAVPTTVIQPEEGEPACTLLYLHGGGYVSLGPGAYHGLAGNLARMLQARVFIPDYRLAPQFQFPIPIDDCFEAYQAVLKSLKDHDGLALAGDSAGGAMVVTLMTRARGEHLRLPNAAVAISPWANLTHRGESMYDRDNLDPICSRAALQTMARAFLGTALPDDPDASPVFADVRGLAPTLIQIGENEVMLSDAIRLASHLSDQRVRTTLEVWPGMVHVWHRFAGTQPESDSALQNAVHFLRQHLDLRRPE